jgi:hypothetical protein
MPSDDIVALLIAERDRLNRAIEALQSSAGHPDSSPAGEGPKRHVSAATRRRIALAQKKRWAARKGSSMPASQTAPPAPKRRISEEGMQRIIAAAKKRWARKRAEDARKNRAVKQTAARKKTATKRTPPKAA